MWKVSLLVLLVTGSKLKILSPNDLSVEFPSGEVPFQFLLEGKLFYNEKREFDLVIPNDPSGCSSLGSNVSSNSILLISQGNCPFLTKIQNAQNASSAGVIIISSEPQGTVSSNRYAFRNYQKSSDLTIFGLIIDYNDGYAFQKYENIRLSLEISIPSAQKPIVTIGLTGINFIDHSVISSAFRYLTGSEYDLEISYDYQECLECEASVQEKHCIGNLCLLDPLGVHSGATMVTNTFRHLCALRHTTSIDFLSYMLKITSNCNQDYQECTYWAFEKVYNSLSGLDECVEDKLKSTSTLNTVPNHVPAPGMAINGIPILVNDEIRETLCLGFDYTASVCHKYCDVDNACFHEVKGNNVCELTCNCYENLHDCDECEAGCSYLSLGNQVCNDECKDEGCFYDQSDCEMCSCNLDVLYDGKCDVECNTEQCGFDGGDCQIPWNSFQTDDQAGSDDDVLFIILVVLGSVLIFSIIVFIVVKRVILKRHAYIIVQQRNNINASRVSRESLIDINVPVEVLNEKTVIKGNRTCTICLGDVAVGETVRRTSCLHVFHTACIDAWIRARTDNPRCPNCNSCLLVSQYFS